MTKNRPQVSEVLTFKDGWVIQKWQNRGQNAWKFEFESFSEFYPPKQ